MDALVIVAGDLPGDPSLQLRQRHPCRRGGLIAAPVGGIAERRSRQHVHRAHRGADQALDVAAKMRHGDRSPLHLDAVIAAGPLEGTAAEIGAVVDMQGLGQAGGRPGRVNATLGQPAGLVVDGVQETEADRGARRRLHGQMEARHHAGHHVNGQRDPRPSSGLAVGLVDDDDIDLCVVDLHDLKRPGDFVGPGRCDTRPDQARLAPTGRTHAIVDTQEPGLDGPPGGRWNALLSARRRDLRDDPPQRGSGRLQIFALQEFLDQRIPDRLLM